jgi:putative ABC transport system substrate-binding protein
MVTRRQVVRGAGVTGLALLAGCGRLPWQAAPPPRMPRIGFLVPGTSAAITALLEAFRQGLHDYGYTDGQNITIEYRYSEAQPEQLAQAAAELVELNVDVIVTANLGNRAAANATTKIPIVLAVTSDPVRSGLVSSIAHPGGNVTGLNQIAPELAGKRLELLKEALPGATRVAAIWNSVDGAMATEYGETLAAASALGIELLSLTVRELSDLERAYERAVSERIEALVIIADVFTRPNRARIAELAAKSGLPAISGDSEYAAAGGLMAYGPSLPGMWRRAAYYVDRILKGAKPADLPVEQPREFEFVVNLKTAQALWLTIPQHVLLQATEVIQ